MYPRLSFVVGLAGAAAAAVAACSTTDVGGEGTSSGGAAHPTSGTGAGVGGITGSGSAVASSSSSGPMGPCNMDPDVDGDADGWTPNEGDCNDCDPTVNPGAVDVALAMDGGAPVPVDRDCDGKAALPAPCDDGLLLDDTDPWSAARALELCQVATAQTEKKDRHWGVLDARWTSASGEEARKPGLQVGIQEGFGPSVHPQSGARLLALSTGRARLPNQADACGGPSCTTASNIDPPADFPQAVPGCDGGYLINDDVALEVSLRTPTNAAGFAFAFKFHSFEFPAWICTPYNDQFIALVSPPPAGSIHGNVAFDSAKKPVSVNLGFFDACDPATQPEFATNCGAPVDQTCPQPPSPYCAGGIGALAGTGFDVWGDAGATRWLTTQAPIKGGSDITVRFALWDTTDQSLDSTVLLDGFSWIPVGATVGVSTEPVVSPK